jgi:hypothetical protein
MFSSIDRSRDDCGVYCRLIAGMAYVIFMCRPRMPILLVALASWQSGTEWRPGLPGHPE